MKIGKAIKDIDRIFGGRGGIERFIDEGKKAKPKWVRADDGVEAESSGKSDRGVWVRKDAYIRSRDGWVANGEMIVTGR